MWNVGAWLKVSTLLAQCVVSPFVPILLTKEPKLWCILSCLSKRAVEQTVEMQVSRKLMKLRICYYYVICHSVIDDIIVPVCDETTGHQWIPVACKGSLELNTGASHGSKILVQWYLICIIRFMLFICVLKYDLWAPSYLMLYTAWMFFQVKDNIFRVYTHTRTLHVYMSHAFTCWCSLCVCVCVCVCVCASIWDGMCAIL